MQVKLELTTCLRTELQKSVVPRLLGSEDKPKHATRTQFVSSDAGAAGILACSARPQPDITGSATLNRSPLTTQTANSSMAWIKHSGELKRNL